MAETIDDNNLPIKIPDLYDDWDSDMCTVTEKDKWKSAWWLVRSCKGKVCLADWSNICGYKDLVRCAMLVYKHRQEK